MQGFVSGLKPAVAFATAGFCVSKKDFVTLHENLWIFMEGEKDCGNLKISRFSGRFPDGRNCFSCACAPEKTERDVHAAALDWEGACPHAFSTVWIPCLKGRG